MYNIFNKKKKTGKMEWLKSEVFNLAAMARLLGMKRADLYNRLYKKYYRFTEIEIEKIKELKEKIIKELSNEKTIEDNDD